MTLGWTRFWFAWAHNQVKEMRERRDRDIWQMWTASLPLGSKHADEDLKRLREANEAEEAGVIKRLAASLPLSVRPLVEEIVPAVAESPDEVWRNLIDQYEEGSPHWHFYRAAQIEQQRKNAVQEQGQE